MAMNWGTNVSSDRTPNETFLSPFPTGRKAILYL